MKLKKQKYNYCIGILYDDIKKILINEVKKYDKNYQYTNIKELKMKCIEYLDDLKSDIAVELYNFTVTPEINTYELKRLLEIYSNLY